MNYNCKTDHDPVTVHDCVESVCNCENCTLRKLFMDGLLDQFVCSV